MSQLVRSLQDIAKRAPQTMALVEDESHLTFEALLQQIQSVAAGLQRSGVTSESRVALMTLNQKEYVISLFAIRWLGATVVPINIQMLPTDIVFVLTHAGVTHLIALNDFYTQLKAFGLPAWVIDLSVDNRTPVTQSFDDLLAASSSDLHSELPVASSDPTAMSFLIYTSGTSGEPKGVMLSEANMISNIEGFSPIFQFTPSDQVVLALPLFHAYGLIIALAVLTHGAKMVLVPKFHPKHILHQMVQHHVTVLPLVPSLFNVLMIMLEKQPELTFPHLKFCISGGESLPLTVLKGVESRLNAPVLEGYGLTETSPVLAVNLPDKGSVPQSVGPAITNVQIDIRHPENSTQSCAVGEEGEICANGPNVMLGYYQNDDATQAAFTPDGWFMTGDLGRLDADGYIYITGRKKDLIIKAGENIAPRPIEEAIRQLDGIAEVAVFGVPHPKTGEAIVACVSLKEGVTLSEADIKAHCRQHLTPTHQPDKISFMPELPKNATGKILKKVLKQTWIEQADVGVSV